jgi:hypothetical protein
MISKAEIIYNMPHTIIDYSEFIESNPVYRRAKIDFEMELFYDRQMTVEDVLGKCRFTEIVTVRYAIGYHLFQSMTAIPEANRARYIGQILNRDRTTAIHMIQSFREKLCIGDKDTIKTWNSLQEFLKQNNAEGV